MLLSATGAVSGLVGTASPAITLFYEIASVAVALVPCIATLFLYILCMNCRRVAQFRGYVKFLEKCVNDEVGITDHLYNTVVDPEMMGKFKPNQKGPIFMVFFWFILYILSAVLGFQMAGFSGGSIYTPVYYVVFSVVLIFSVLCSVLCIYWLTQNGKAMDDTYKLCVKFSP